MVAVSGPIPVFLQVFLLVKNAPMPGTIPYRLGGAIFAVQATEGLKKKVV